MPTCKNCIHYEVCADFYDDEIERAIPCSFFKSRSRFVELPCKAGDTLYANDTDIQSARVMALYIDQSGGMFDLDITKYVKTGIGYKHEVSTDYTFEDIGKRLFLTKKEAEQALRKGEVNDPD